MSREKNGSNALFANSGFMMNVMSCDCYLSEVIVVILLFILCILHEILIFSR